MSAWEPLEGETEAAYQAFLLYLDGGAGYSLRKLAEDHFPDSPGKLRVLEEWSSTYSWVKRRLDYIHELEAERQGRLEDVRKECEDLLADKAKELTEALITAAIATKDPRLLKDALDRVGVTRKKADGGLIRGKFEFSLENMPDTLLQQIIDALSE